MMNDADQTAGADGGPGDAMARLGAALGATKPGRGAPPVEQWNPPFCGDIDMRIDAEGNWFYNGTPIGRPGLVKLFASVLRRDPERYVLVTPVERVGIAVADVPFMAVEMALSEGAAGRQLAFRTNVDDLVEVGAEHPLRFETDGADGLKPYVLVRGGLWARVTRALTYDLVELGEERDVAEVATFGVAVGGDFYPIAPVSDMPEGLAT